MSNVSDLLTSFAVAAAKEAAKKALQWAVDKLRAKASEAGIEIDQNAAEALVAAHLQSLHAATWVMAQSIDADIEKLAESERRFRESSNVEVVESMEEEK